MMWHYYNVGTGFWRVENLVPVPIPVQNTNTLYRMPFTTGSWLKPLVKLGDTLLPKHLLTTPGYILVSHLMLCEPLVTFNWYLFIGFYWCFIWPPNLLHIAASITPIMTFPCYGYLWLPTLYIVLSLLPHISDELHIMIPDIYDDTLHINSDYML